MPVWESNNHENPVLFPPSFTGVCLLNLPGVGDIWNPAHPLIVLDSGVHMDLPGFAEQGLLERLDSASEPRLVSWCLREIVRRALSGTRSIGNVVYLGLSGSWETYRQKRASHLTKLWRIVAAAAGCPLDNLVLYAASENKHVKFSPSEWKVVNIQLGALPILPEVTDPQWLVEEVDQETVGG